MCREPAIGSCFCAREVRLHARKPGVRVRIVLVVLGREELVGLVDVVRGQERAPHVEHELLVRGELRVAALEQSLLILRGTTGSAA